LATRPQLALQLNRRNFGRLREIVDAINAAAPAAIEQGSAHQ
jgi:hypothetical protein